MAFLFFLSVFVPACSNKKPFAERQCFYGMCNSEEIREQVSVPKKKPQAVKEVSPILEEKPTRKKKRLSFFGL
jgi:hypothetical protein